MLALTLTLVLAASPVEECKSSCAQRGNGCRVTCRSQALKDLCFTLCRNDETDCKGDCGMGIDQSKQRGVVAGSLNDMETKCAAGNGRACLRGAAAFFNGRDGVKDENKGAQLLNAGCGRREADACAAVGNLQLEGRAVPKNISGALDAFEKACEWGSPLGCFSLARALESGVSGKSDPVRTKKLYTEACSAEFGPSCLALGRFLEKPGAMQDLEKAESYTEKACDLDDTTACDALCSQTRQPDGAPRDQLQSLGYCGKACDGQVMSACTSEALMLLGGPPFKPNPKKARELLDAACDGADATGCMLVGEALEKGLYGWKKNPADSKRAYERAAMIVEAPCRKGEAQACSLAAMLSIEGNGGPPPGPDTRARLEPLCGKADSRGCAALGAAWLLPACGAVSATKAMEALQLGCQSKSQVACRRLAALLQAGAEGVPADGASAATLFDGACDADDGPSCLALAKMLSAGTGVPKDAKKAKVVAKKGCKLGEKDACKIH